MGKCQSNDFDAQIADATITMILHILLTLKYRVENYESMTGLFSEIKEAAIRQRLNQRLWGLFIELMQIITIVFEGLDEQELLERIFSSDEVSDRITRLLNNAGQTDKAA